MMYYDVLTIYGSNIQRKSSRTCLWLWICISLSNWTHQSWDAQHITAEGWMQTCESSLEKNLVRKASWWELLQFVGGKCVFSTLGLQDFKSH